MGNGWSTRILVGLVTMLVAWTAYEAIETRTFREAGGRFTMEDGLKMGNRISLLEQRGNIYIDRVMVALADLKRETDRLQLQIDRLEGHDVDTYTEDRKRK